jgi:D-serine deaminase-like pyridoxal phosphate-dependent protein
VRDRTLELSNFTFLSFPSSPQAFSVASAVFQLLITDYPSSILLPSLPMSKTLLNLETPCLVLDANRLEQNIARMREKMGAHKVALRPHVKTAKCLEIIQLALGDDINHGKITVSTLKEAEFFFAAGISDILYAVGITPNKLDHVLRLRRSGADLTIILDNADAARIVSSKGALEGERFPVLLEIDSDGHRAGVQPDHPHLVELARIVSDGNGTVLRGVMTHAGSSYGRSGDGIRDTAERERRAVVQAAEHLRTAGLPCPIVSVGSTPTATFAENFDGVTEVRAGVYMFQDLVMAGAGVCSIDDIAISVLTTVLGHQSEKGWIITDAGWMALSRDRGTARQKIDQGYGKVCDIEGKPVGDLNVLDTNQEHGIIGDRLGHTVDLSQFPVGTQLRILPNHACATAAQHSSYQVVRGGITVDDVWERFNGW